MECITCLDVDLKKKNCASLSLDSLQELLHRPIESPKYKYGSVMNFVGRT